MNSTEFSIQPITGEELAALLARLEEEGDYESELARALFTVLVTLKECETFFATLQAYYAAGSAACFDVAQMAGKIIGLRDRKKLDAMTEVAAEFAGNIPARAMDILSERGFFEGDTYGVSE